MSKQTRFIFERPLEAMISEMMDMGIRDFRVIDAMRRIPRHIFLDEALHSRAYENCSWPIGHKQTISQPFIVAKMTELILEALPRDQKKFNRILEIGSGCGYQTSILSFFADEVHAMERIKALVLKSREHLSELKIHNTIIKHRDGFEGWDERISYNAILCAAAPLEVPERLLKFLSPGGILVLPVGPENNQILKKITFNNGEFIEVDYTEVSFVPMLAGLNK